MYNVFDKNIFNNKLGVKDATFAARTYTKMLGNKLDEYFYDNRKYQWRTWNNFFLSLFLTFPSEITRFQAATSVSEITQIVPSEFAAIKLTNTAFLNRPPREASLLSRGGKNLYCRRLNNLVLIQVH